MAAIPAAAGINRHGILKETFMGFEFLKPGAILASLLFALIGVAVFWLCFVIIDKITPYDLWSEIVEKQNVALALVVAAMSLGICIIVAAAIH
jgi:putative membrane protein